MLLSVSRFAIVCGCLYLIAGIAAAPAVRADVYGQFESDGSILFTDKPIPGRKADRVIPLTVRPETSARPATVLQQLRSRDKQPSDPSSSSLNFQPSPLSGRLPIRGRLTSTPGQRRDPFDGTPRWHNGADIAAPIGTPVPSIAPGTVAFSGKHAGYGNIVVVDHGNGVSLYAHLERAAVREGDTIGPQQTLGYTGNSGRSTGPHLHFEAWEEGHNVTQRFIDATPLADRSGAIKDRPPAPVRMVRQSDGSILLTNQRAIAEPTVRYFRQPDGSILITN